MKSRSNDMWKFFASVLCCFVPKKMWRKSIRYNLAYRRIRRAELLDMGFSIDGDIITTPHGVHFDISHKADHPLYLIKEVFVKSEYNLNLGEDSILIDIGMNRGAASLLFASDANIKKVYSYEPFKPTYEFAIRNIELNPELNKKIDASNCGLGKEDKTLELPYIINATGGMSTTHDVCKDQKNTKTETVVVKDAAKEFVRILDENKNRHIIVKCDCEGAEFEIFERLVEKDLVNKIDAIMMEYHFEKPDRLIEILTKNSFAVQSKHGSSKSKTGYLYAVRMAKKN
ncbi:FkbM family methyltransferase [Planctomycetota bacterium]